MHTDTLTHAGHCYTTYSCNRAQNRAPGAGRTRDPVARAVRAATRGPRRVRCTSRGADRPLTERHSSSRAVTYPVTVRTPAAQSRVSAGLHGTCRRLGLPGRRRARPLAARLCRRGAVGRAPTAAASHVHRTTARCPQRSATAPLTTGQRVRRCWPPLPPPKTACSC